MLLGSPKYMSPEQVIGKRADHRSDIFSLGVILYEMLAGAAPFNGENVTALMYQIVNFVPPAPSASIRAVPEMLDFIVAKMLAKPLEERYQDARELARDLRECERSLAAPPAGTHAGHPAGLASGLQPQIVDTAVEDRGAGAAGEPHARAGRGKARSRPARRRRAAFPIRSIRSRRRSASPCSPAPPPRRRPRPRRWARFRARRAAAGAGATGCWSAVRRLPACWSPARSSRNEARA